jgi:ATP-dependent RNA/DNA helicase IGHMBP2
MEYFEEQLVLLKQEWQIDKEQFETMLYKSTLQERRAAGNTWYPLKIKDVEPAPGDYIVVVLERTTGLEATHNFRFGMPAALFSNHDAGNNRVEGIIQFANSTTIKLHLRLEELPDWADDGKLGIDLLFDENSYREMQNALLTADAKLKENKEVELIKSLTGISIVHQDNRPSNYKNEKLNESQVKAVHQILGEATVAIIHGPPGTGKTTTLVNSIKALWQQNHQPILVCAASNTAVDLLTEKLDEQGLNVVRIGNPIRIGASLQSLSLDAKIHAHDANKTIKKMRQQANEYKKMALKYKRNFGKAEREQRKLLILEAKKLMQDVGKEEQYISKDILDKAHVITATLTGANHYSIRDRNFETLVIDEAAQALEPSCWIALLKAKRVILAGDHCQLPPTIKSTQTAVGKGLYHTLFEKNIGLHDITCMLDIQYRMHEQIMQYSNATFYESKLIAAESVKQATISESEKPILFIDTAGCGFTEVQENVRISNPESAAFLLKQLNSLLTNLPNANELKIGVMAPYKQQVILLQELILHHIELQPYLKNISINTIDSFQGQERDIIFIDLVRSNDEGVIGFLSDTRRMNVALTRAKKKLVVIGDSATISTHPFYDGFINYAQSIDSYVSAWELMY